MKFLDIKPAEIETKLVSVGAAKAFDRVFRRRVFDYPDLRLNSKGAYVRVRDEGDKITFAYKERQGIGQSNGNDLGMKEIEVSVSDFEQTCELLRNVGLVEKFYEENRRVRYLYKGIEFDIDYWPLLSPFLEIEAENMGKIEEGISLLGLKSKEKKVFTVFQIYKLKGINELDYKVLTFEKQV